MNKPLVFSFLVLVNIHTFPLVFQVKTEDCGVWSVKSPHCSHIFFVVAAVRWCLVFTFTVIKWTLEVYF